MTSTPSTNTSTSLPCYVDFFPIMVNNIETYCTTRSSSELQESFEVLFSVTLVINLLVSICSFYAFNIRLKENINSARYHYSPSPNNHHHKKKNTNTSNNNNNINVLLLRQRIVHGSGDLVLLRIGDTALICAIMFIISVLKLNNPLQATVGHDTATTLLFAVLSSLIILANVFSMIEKVTVASAITLTLAGKKIDLTQFKIILVIADIICMIGVMTCAIGLLFTPQNYIVLSQIFWIMFGTAITCNILLEIYVLGQIIHVLEMGIVTIVDNNHTDRIKIMTDQIVRLRASRLRNGLALPYLLLATPMFMGVYAQYTYIYVITLFFTIPLSLAHVPIRYLYHRRLLRSNDSNTSTNNNNNRINNLALSSNNNTNNNNPRPNSIVDLESSKDIKRKVREQRIHFLPYLSTLKSSHATDIQE
jgi:hypothetical protein